MISTGLKLSSNLNEGAMYLFLYWQFNRLEITKITIKITIKFNNMKKLKIILKIMTNTFQHIQMIVSN